MTNTLTEMIQAYFSDPANLWQLLDLVEQY
jgi:hypothetical protein